MCETFGSRSMISEEFLQSTDLQTIESILKDNLKKDAAYKGFVGVSDAVVTWDAQSYLYGNTNFPIPCDMKDKGAWRYAYCRMEVVKDA